MENDHKEIKDFEIIKDASGVGVKFKADKGLLSDQLHFSVRKLPPGKSAVDRPPLRISKLTKATDELIANKVRESSSWTKVFDQLAKPSLKDPK